MHSSITSLIALLMTIALVPYGCIEPRSGPDRNMGGGAGSGPVGPPINMDDGRDDDLRFEEDPQDEDPCDEEHQNDGNSCDLNGAVAVRVSASVSWPGGLVVEGNGPLDIYFLGQLDQNR